MNTPNKDPENSTKNDLLEPLKHRITCREKWPAHVYYACIYAYYIHSIAHAHLKISNALRLENLILIFVYIFYFIIYQCFCFYSLIFLIIGKYFEIILSWKYEIVRRCVIFTDISRKWTKKRRCDSYIILLFNFFDEVDIWRDKNNFPQFSDMSGNFLGKFEEKLIIRVENSIWGIFYTFKFVEIVYILRVIAFVH